MMPSTLLILAALSQSPRPAPDWKPVKPADGSFTAEMPVEPKRLDRTVDGPNGPIRQVVHYGKVGGALYSIQSIETPSRGTLAGRKSAAKLERDQYLKGDGGKLVAEEAVFDDGRPGWDIVLKGPAPAGGQGTVTSRVRMLVEDRVTYTLTVMSAKDKPLPEEAGRFFDSFRPGRPGEGQSRRRAPRPPGGSGRPRRSSGRSSSPCSGPMRRRSGPSRCRRMTSNWLWKGGPSRPKEQAKEAEGARSPPGRSGS